jgi:cytidyltransferase-like protein
MPAFNWDFRLLPNGSESCKITPMDTKCHIDIFPLSRSSDGVRCYNNTILFVAGHTAKRWAGARLHKLYHFENLKKIKFEGLDFHISKYAEQTLDFLYSGVDGTDNTWRKPVSYDESNWDKNTSRDKDDKITGCVVGVFDLFHVGHLRLLERSREIFDKVVAAVHNDDTVLAYKNKVPTITYEHRVEMLKGCKFVDEVIEAPIPDHMEGNQLPGVEFLNNNDLDYMVHSYAAQEFLDYHYASIIKEHRLFLLEATPDYHTTDLINTINEN